MEINAFALSGRDELRPDTQGVALGYKLLALQAVVFIGTSAGVTGRSFHRRHLQAVTNSFCDFLSFRHREKWRENRKF
ncbi:MAG: hypothetical protein IJM81_02765 [Prevotella sp.]|nr:hypothetical protein [Prevotella sp.]